MDRERGILMRYKEAHTCRELHNLDRGILMRYKEAHTGLGTAQFRQGYSHEVQGSTHRPGNCTI
jgi:hypothetical protein